MKGYPAFDLNFTGDAYHDGRVTKNIKKLIGVGEIDNTMGQHSYDTLKNNKLGCVGSNKMIFAMSDFNYDVFAIDCGDNKKLIHEATIMMTKRWHRASCGFGDNSQGEGKDLFFGMEKKVAITDIRNVMCCLQHRWNTVDKRQFATPEKKIDMNMDENLKKILDKIIKNN